MELTLDQALQKGIEAHKAGKAQEADRYYTAIIKANPKHPDANHNMGVLAVGVGKLQEALPFFKTALEANPKIAQFWLSYIDALIKLDRMADAKEVFDQAKSKGAKGDGFDQTEKRLNTSSVEVKNQTLEDTPTQSNILDELKLGKALKIASKKAKDGLSEEAKKIYQDILAKFPRNKTALVGIKTLSGQTTNKNSNIQDPPQKQLQSLINLYTQGQYKGTLNEASKLLVGFPNSANLYNIIGIANQGLGKLGEAIEAFNKAILIKPDYAEVHYNMGNALKDRGKLDEAVDAYRKAISVKPKYRKAYGNMGMALQKQSKLNEAVEAYKKALSIKPDYAEAYYNMGNALKEQDKLEEAIEGYKNALSIKPDFAEAWNNMGNALKEQGKLEEAIESYKKALSIKPDFAQAYYNMGVTFRDQKKPKKAIEAYSKALSINPDYFEAWNNMRIALPGMIFNKPSRELQKAIVSLLDRKTYARPIDIASAAISLLKFEPSLQKYLKMGDNEVIQSPIDVISDLSELPLLVKLMSISPLPDLGLENLSRKLRASLLLSLSDITGSTESLNFQSALALQCFTNEYIYSHTEEEGKILQSLEANLKEAFKNNEQPSPQIILALASYKALNQYEWSGSLLVNDEIKDVFTRQVVEPNQEAKFKSVLPLLDDITDEVSSKVRDQYEESPYPRWVNLGLPLQPMSISKTVDEILLKLHDNKISEVEKPEILVAGCGTGQHSIGTASRFKNSKVLAIDLSLSSLSYAKRKTEELGFENIDYMQADILDLGKLDRQFDIVESAGVLHHMDDPEAGWKVLTDCLKPGGLMKIGLYSELARQHIVKIRKEISNAGIGSNDQEMKSFRDTIMRSEKDHHERILISSDFYSLSELKDLLFHVQEHRFTIPQIKGHLDKLGLKFCGFESSKIVSNFKQTNKNKSDPYDLDKWQAYEEANPKTFVGMYQFWCQKAE